jgi:hypothetical protein
MTTIIAGDGSHDSKHNKEVDGGKNNLDNTT